MSRPPRGGAAPKSSASAPAGRSGRTGRRVLALLAAGLLALVAWVGLSLLQPFAGDGGEPVTVEVPEGAGVGQIAEILEDRGVISSSFFFGVRARLSGSSTTLKPGAYRLRRGASHASVLDVLAAGVPPDVVTVTVPEGRSRGEIGPIVRSARLDGSYARASARSRTLDAASYGADGAKSLEGFLFPDTYELKRGSSAAALVRDQLEAFRRRFSPSDLRVEGRDETPYEVLIVASMVEREAQIDSERPVIASVIYNRLDRGQYLGIDATIRYATRNWSSPLKQSELMIDSPFNTRRNFGLPPGPIGNPGRESIEAAARPAESDFLYYVVKPCGEGAHNFSETEAEFRQNQAAYEAERARLGGRSPVSC